MQHTGVETAAPGPAPREPRRWPRCRCCSLDAPLRPARAQESPAALAELVFVDPNGPVEHVLAPDAGRLPHGPAADPGRALRWAACRSPISTRPSPPSSRRPGPAGRSLVPRPGERWSRSSLRRRRRSARRDRVPPGPRAHGLAARLLAHQRRPADARRPGGRERPRRRLRGQEEDAGRRDRQAARAAAEALPATAALPERGERLRAPRRRALDHRGHGGAIRAFEAIAERLEADPSPVARGRSSWRSRRSES